MSTPTGESWQAKVGGEESPVKGTYTNETVSVKKMGERTIEVTYKRDGKLYSVSKISVSADGKMIADSPTKLLISRPDRIVTQVQPVMRTNAISCDRTSQANPTATARVVTLMSRPKSTIPSAARAAKNDERSQYLYMFIPDCCIEPPRNHSACCVHGAHLWIYVLSF